MSSGIDIIEKEKIEIDYWKNSSWENSSSFSDRNFISKSFQCKNFNYKVRKYRKHINGSNNVLELGAGQGWASCFLKRFYLPQAHITVSDISPYAIDSIKYWENVFDVKINESLSCQSYDIPSPSGSYDLIFCYAAAHHFVKLDETLDEIKRVLKRNGKAIFLYEPTCSKLFYPIHFKYVNKNPHVPEDILIVDEIKAMAEKHNLTCVHHYDSKQVNIHSVGIGLYFSILNKMKFLERLLPSSSDFIFVNNK